MLKQQGLPSMKKRRLSWGKGGHNNKFSILTMGMSSYGLSSHTFLGGEQQKDE